LRTVHISCKQTERKRNFVGESSSRKHVKAANQDPEQTGAAEKSHQKDHTCVPL